MNSWIFAAASWCTIFVKAAIWCDYKIALSFSIRNKLSTISSDWWAWQRKRKSVHSACIWFIFVRFSLIKSLLFSSKYWNNGLLWSFHVIEGNICHLTFCNKLTSIKVYCVFMRDVPLLYWFQSFICTYSVQWWYFILLMSGTFLWATRAQLWRFFSHFISRKLFQ